jgi:hypothetical protein
VPAFAPTRGCADCERLAGDEQLTPGEALSLRYAGFRPGEEVSVVMRSTPVDLGTFTADADGVVTAEVTIPETAEAGSHTLTLSGAVTGEHVVRFRLARAEQTRTRATPAGEEPTLPLLLGLGGGGLVLAAGGATLLLRERRSRRAGETADQATATPIAEPIA